MSKSVTLKNKHIAPISKPGNSKFSVIIPAAGVGSRMRSYGAKSLLKLNDSVTILDNQLTNIYKNFPKVEIIIVYGFDGNKIYKKYAHSPSVKCVENENYNTTNVVSSIDIGLQHTTTNRVLIIYGDLVFNAHTLQSPFGAYSMVIVDQQDGLMGKDEVGCVIHNHTLERMMYDLPNKWGQIAYFEGLELQLLRELCHKTEHQMYFGFEIINMIMNHGGTFTTYSSKFNKIIDVDSSKHLIQAKAII